MRSTVSLKHVNNRCSIGIGHVLAGGQGLLRVVAGSWFCQERVSARPGEHTYSITYKRKPQRIGRFVRTDPLRSTAVGKRTFLCKSTCMSPVLATHALDIIAKDFLGSDRIFLRHMLSSLMVFYDL